MRVSMMRPMPGVRFGNDPMELSQKLSKAEPRLVWQLSRQYQGGPIRVLLGVDNLTQPQEDKLKEVGFTTRVNAGTVRSGEARDLQSLIAVNALEFVHQIEGSYPLHPELR